MPATVLVRHARLSSDRRRVESGPVPGGRFWAVEGAEDLPWFACDHGHPYDGDAGRKRLRCQRHNGIGHQCRARLATLLAAGCRAWWRKAGVGAAWVEVHGEGEIPTPAVVQVPCDDGFGSEPGLSFVVEVYVVGHRGGLALPAGWRKENNHAQS